MLTIGANPCVFDLDCFRLAHKWRSIVLGSNSKYQKPKDQISGARDIRRLVAGGAGAIALIKALGPQTAAGKPIEFKDKPYHKGTIIGGALFGVGWAVTGACPGPIYAQIGSGEWLALTTFAGALSGAYLYALLKPRLPH